MYLKTAKKLFTPTIMMAWALYYYIEILGKKASAGLFIKPVFWIMLGLYALIVLMDARDSRDEAKAEAQKAATLSEEELKQKEEKAAAQKADLQRTLICIGSALLYVFVLPYLGFLISTTAILFGMFCWLKVPGKVRSLLVAIVIAVGMYCLFKLGLKVPLPTGFLGFI